MFDFLFRRRRETQDLVVLIQLMKGIRAMALDLSKLNAAVARNTAAVDALVASHSDPAAQAAVDEAAAAVDKNSEKAEAAVAPPVA
jgi:hypothetical protein